MLTPELWNVPLQCSQGGIPYNKQHIEYWKRRSEEADTEIATLRTQVERQREALNGIRQAYEDAPGWANPTPTTELVYRMYSLALAAFTSDERK